MKEKKIKTQIVHKFSASQAMEIYNDSTSAIERLESIAQHKINRQHNNKWLLLVMTVLAYHDVYEDAEFCISISRETGNVE